MNVAEKCPVCKTGKLHLSGTHNFCDKCNFSVFTMTQGYIDSCVVVLAELVSNTKFKNRNDLGHTVLDHVAQHLPYLDRYLTSVVGGRDKLGTAVLLEVESQAINLQIGAEILGATEAANDLRCQCGDENFHMITVGKLVCKNEECEAVYLYEESSGTFQPEFLCKCGWAAYAQEHEDDPLVQCTNCHTNYMKTVHGFQMVGA